MYSGTTIRVKSGRIMGAHQKIDRVSRRQLSKIIPKNRYFPLAEQILHFEGANGPDGIKRKSPSRDEPWHFVDPRNPKDMAIYTLINDHIANLINALSKKDEIRAAFEAAWLSHAVVDALTPAHHYPLSEKIEELWGTPKEDRLNIRDKNIIRGINRRDSLLKNWQYWGAKGVFTTHVMFELGVASTITPLRFSDVLPDTNVRIRALKEGFEPLMREAVEKVYMMNMYETYYQQGWNRRLARQTRQELVPTIIRAVILAWYYAGEIAANRRKAQR